MQTYMEALGKFEKGQQVPVKIIRNKEEKIVQVTYSSAVGALSTILPTYITATRSLMCSTTLKSWATNR